MEDLGDFLYIIFAIIGIVYSIIKKNNKKAKQATPPVQAAEEDADFEDDIPTFERIFGNGEKPKVPKPEVVSQATQVQAMGQTVEEKKRQIEDNFSRIKSTRVKEEEGIKDDVLVTEESGFDFDLKQAVIYSEVLKRPEF